MRLNRTPNSNARLTQTTNVAFHAHVVEVVFGGINLTRIHFCLVLLRENLLLAKLSIVIKVDLGVETHHCHHHNTRDKNYVFLTSRQITVV